MKRLILIVLIIAAANFAYAKEALVEWENSYVNTRAEPSQTSKKTGTIPKGGKVEILVQKGEWAKVRHSGGEGWVTSKSLKVLPEKPVPQPAAAEARAAAPVEPPKPVAEPVQPSVPALSPAAAPQVPGGYLSGVSEKPSLPEVSVGKTLVSLVTGLMLVLGIIGGIVWALRKFMGKTFPALQGANAIRVLASKPLAQRQAVMLVEVGGEIFFISQTDSDIRLLSKIESPAALDRLDYLFSFKPTKFEAELRKELDIEGKEMMAAEAETAPASNGNGKKDEKDGLSPSERLARLRTKPGGPESP